MLYRQALYTRREWTVGVRDMAIALVAAYVLALSAQAKVMLPFSPVPVTSQTLVVLLIGALLGRRIGLLSVGAYLVAGGIGLPFFAGGNLAGPTGGYLVGFAASVAVLSALMDKGWGRRLATAVPALLLGTSVIYLFGLPWLALYVGLSRVIALGLVPFVVGDLLKVVCAASILAAREQLSARKRL